MPILGLQSMLDDERRLLEKTEINTAQKVEGFSFGNRKKTAIICALQHDPDLPVLTGPQAAVIC